MFVGIVAFAIVRIAAASLDLAMIQAGPSQKRFAHDLLREVIGRRRPDGAEFDRIVVDAILVLRDGQDIARIDRFCS